MTNIAFQNPNFPKIIKATMYSKRFFLYKKLKLHKNSPLNFNLPFKNFHENADSKGIKKKKKTIKLSKKK